MADAGGYLGTNYPTPTDPNFYLSQVGLSSLVPQAFNANTLSAMFAPQGMQYTPVNSQATNPFEQSFMQDAAKSLKLQQRKPGPGQEDQQQMQQEGMY